ncbi:MULTISPECIES: glycosyltransferase family 4 protein [Rahnella]|uniref:glycosyltransferase family 4 protein n=1 Tax=Rahnella TaxID=34037 RepID=UPI001C259D0D|nr:glycosyltransferase family 4 protein [Rahnella rivi]
MIIIDGIIFSLQQSGGISVYFDELIKEIKKNDISYSLIVYDNNNPYVEGLPVNTKTRLNMNIERFLDVDLGFFEKGSSIFHSSYYRLPNKKIRSELTVITTVHDFTEEIFSRGAKSYVHHWQKKRAILGSDGIICISECTKKDLLKFIPEAANIPIKVIYNGVGDFKPAANKKSSEKYVLFVGARNGYKNFSACVQSLSTHSDLNLVVVGGGQFTNDEINFLEGNVPGRYRHAGYVTEVLLNDLYSQAYCLIYPSLYEGFGIPVIEAMKSGCPVIGSNSSSVSEIASGAAILIDDITSDKISDALVVLKDDVYRSNLIATGFEHSQKYSWSKMAEQTLNFYNEIRDPK